MRLFQRNSLCFEVDSLRPCFSSVFAENPNNVDTDHFLSQRSSQSRECFAQIFSTFFPSRSSILRAKIIMISPLYLLWTFLSLFIFSAFWKVEHFFESVMSRIIKLDGKCHRGAFRVVLWIVGPPATCLARVCVRLCPSSWSSSCFYGSFVKVLHFKGQCVQKSLFCWQIMFDG